MRSMYRVKFKEGIMSISTAVLSHSYSSMLSPSHLTGSLRS